MIVEDKLLTFDDWLRLVNVPFVKSSGFVPLIENLAYCWNIQEELVLRHHQL